MLFSECNSAVTPPLIAAVGVCSCSAGPLRRNMQAFGKLKHHCPWCFPGYMTLGECYIKKKEVSNPYVYLDPNRVSLVTAVSLTGCETKRATAGSQSLATRVADKEVKGCFFVSLVYLKEV